MADPAGAARPSGQRGEPHRGGRPGLVIGVLSPALDVAIKRHRTGMVIPHGNGDVAVAAGRVGDLAFVDLVGDPALLVFVHAGLLGLHWL